MIAAFLGNLSAGKTCTATKFVKAEALKGRKIISNIYLNFPKGCNVVYMPLDEIPGKVKNDPNFFKNAVLFIDELTNIAEARRSSAAINVDFTLFVTQLGKLGCDFFYTAQILTSQIDLRIREMGDLYIFCERWVMKDGRWQPALLMPRKVPYPVAIRTVVVLRSMGGMRVQSTKYDYVPTLEDYAAYDTEEIVMLDRDKFKKPVNPFMRY